MVFPVWFLGGRSSAAFLKELILCGLHLLQKSARPDFRLLFNSLSGLASVNHFHFHGFFLATWNGLVLFSLWLSYGFLLPKGSKYLQATNWSVFRNFGLTFYKKKNSLKTLRDFLYLCFFFLRYLLPPLRFFFSSSPRTTAASSASPWSCCRARASAATASRATNARSSWWRSS